MLTWNVTYHCKPGKRDAFYKALCDLGTRAVSNSEDLGKPGTADGSLSDGDFCKAAGA